MIDQADTSLIGLFLRDRVVFERHASQIPEHLLESGTKIVLKDISDWYSVHPSGNIADQIHTFWEWMKLKQHPQLPEAKLGGLRRILENAAKAIGTKTANELLQSLVLRDHAGRIADKADRFSGGETNFDLYNELLDDVERAKRDAGLFDNRQYEVRTGIDKLLERLTSLSGGLTWRSMELNQAVGPIRKGDLIAIAAFVDSGKSTLVASEATHMAAQLKDDEVVLFFNNEEAGDKVRLRLMRAALGWTAKDMLSNRPHIEAEFRQVFGGATFDDRIVIIDNAIITPGLVRSKLRQYNTKLLVFDQLYKLVGLKGGGDDALESLRLKFQYARQLAKEYCPVLAVHQARGDANGVRYIEMHQLAGSQQAIQGEADAIITLGRDLEYPAFRYIYVPKNKMDTPGNNDLRNGKFEVTPDWERSRF